MLENEIDEDDEVEVDLRSGGYVGAGYTKGEPTTKLAAQYVAKNLTNRENAVLRAMIKFNAPVSAHEIAEIMGCGRDAVSPRFADLARKKYIMCIGKQKRPGSHTLCKVWVVNYNANGVK